MSNNTSPESLTVDAEYDITELPPNLCLFHFDKQGYVAWNKDLFAANVYKPTHFDGKKIYEELNYQKKRPLNGHFAFWLKRHQNQIPEDWKLYEMLFMGTVITHSSFIFHEDREPPLTCVKLVFEKDEWNVSLFNFSSYTLMSYHRIPLLPQSL